MSNDPPWVLGNPQPKSGIRGTHLWNSGASPATSAASPAVVADQSYDPFGKGGGGAALRDANGKLVADRRTLGVSWFHTLSTNVPQTTFHIQGAPRRVPQCSFACPRCNYLAAHDSCMLRCSNMQPTFSSQNVASHYKEQNLPPFESLRIQPITERSAERSDSGRFLDPAEQHKMELLKQIEDNKRRKEEERTKELELQRREEAKFEAYRKKLQEEMENEEKRVREKAKAAQRKADHLRELQEDAARRKKLEETGRPTSSANAGLEWWERKRSYSSDGRQSVIIPTIRNKDAGREAVRQGESSHGTSKPRSSRSVSRHSRTSYEPSAAAAGSHGSERSRRGSVQPSASRQSRRAASRISAHGSANEANGRKRQEERAKRESESRASQVPTNLGRVQHSSQTQRTN